MLDRIVAQKWCVIFSATTQDLQLSNGLLLCQGHYSLIAFCTDEEKKKQWFFSGYIGISILVWINYIVLKQILCFSFFFFFCIFFDLQRSFSVPTLFWGRLFSKRAKIWQVQTKWFLTSNGIRHLKETLNLWRGFKQHTL